MENVYYHITTNDFEKVQLLVNKNKDKINTKSVNFNDTVFIHACRMGRIEIVKFLHSSGANINDMDAFLNTGFYLACKNNHIEVVKFLLSINVNVNQKHYNNTTPLMIACKENNIEITELLLEAGANIDDFTFTGYNALSLTTNDKIKNLLTEKINYVTNNKIKKTCIICRQISENNTLIYLNHKCPICFEEKDKVYTFNCGHINCCFECFSNI